MPPVGSGVMTADGVGRVCSLHFLNGKVAVKLEDGKIKEYTKEELEMIDDDVSNIQIDDALSNQMLHHDDTDIDVSDLEDDNFNGSKL